MSQYKVSVNTPRQIKDVYGRVLQTNIYLREIAAEEITASSLIDAKMQAAVLFTRYSNDHEIIVHPIGANFRHGFRLGDFKALPQ